MKSDIQQSTPLKIFKKLIAQKRTKRLETLLATFTNGCAEEWAFPIGKHFQEALDIRLTTQVTDKIATPIWTQGSRFEFREGYTIYDVMTDNLSWLDALQRLSVAFQIKKSSPAIPATNDLARWSNRPDSAVIKQHIASFGQNYVSHEEETKRNGEYTLRVQTKRFAGYLEIAMLVPNERRTALVVKEEFPISQDGFVEWLILGTDPMKRRQHP